MKSLNLKPALTRFLPHPISFNHNPLFSYPITKLRLPIHCTQRPISISRWITVHPRRKPSQPSRPQHPQQILWPTQQTQISKFPNKGKRLDLVLWNYPEIGEIWTDYSPWSTSRNKHRGRTRPTKHTPITLISLENGPETELPTKRDPNQPKEIRLLTLIESVIMFDLWES